MGFRFSKRSLRNLDGIHPDLMLVAVKALALTKVDFIVTDGLRTIEEQKALVAKGASKTMNSRHLTGHAIDFVAYCWGKVTYDPKLMEAVASAFKQASAELKIPIVWGGDWAKFKDTPHIELDRKVYK